ncbi:thiamine biosynthesis protein ThiJ [Elysia marginata]|uniref:Thiamine biosynthesis protein ThiJ n=1 Tax=Elysia marginata TaxID=1093978 RepID=A0AAV4JQ33_9GAST|nr:thiamine biosynthesis protein ThiJ [Elysia marginata]
MDLVLSLVGLDPESVIDYQDDPISQWFLENNEAQALVNNTKPPSEIDASDYAAVLYPGGHGPMFDLAINIEIAAITSQIYLNGGVVGSLCHGPAGLVPVLVNGEPIVKGCKITSFSNAEEDALDLSSHMPFMLESKLKEQGGDFSAADLWEKHVVVDKRLVTGQNPNSAAGVAEAMVDLLS